MRTCPHISNICRNRSYQRNLMHCRNTLPDRYNYITADRKLRRRKDGGKKRDETKGERTKTGNKKKKKLWN